jgi:hypothetical protein
MGTELKEVTLEVKKEENKLVLSLDEQEICFYNDLSYLMDPESDVHL